MRLSTTFCRAAASLGSMALNTVTLPVSGALVAVPVPVPVPAPDFLLSLPHATSSVRATTGTTSTRTLIGPPRFLVRRSRVAPAVDSGPVVGVEEMQARCVDDQLDPVTLLHVGARVQP